MNQKTSEARRWCERFLDNFCERVGRTPNPISPQWLIRIASQTLTSSAPNDMVVFSISLQDFNEEDICQPIGLFNDRLSPNDMWESTPRLPSHFNLGLKVIATFRIMSVKGSGDAKLVIAAWTRSPDSDTPRTTEEKNISLGTLELTYHDPENSHEFFPMSSIASYLGQHPPQELVSPFTEQIEEHAKLDGIIPQFWMFAWDNEKGKLHPNAFLPEKLFDELGKNADDDGRLFLDQLFGGSTTNLSDDELDSFWTSALTCGVNVCLQDISNKHTTDFYKLERELILKDWELFGGSKHNDVLILPYIIDDLLVAMIWTYLPNDPDSRRRRLLFLKSLITSFGERVARTLILHKIRARIASARSVLEFDELINRDKILNKLARSKHFVAMRAFAEERQRLEVNDATISLCATAIPHHIKNLYQDIASLAANLKADSNEITDEGIAERIRKTSEIMNKATTSVRESNEFLLKLRKNQILDDIVNVDSSVENIKSFTGAWVGFDHRITWPKDVSADKATPATFVKFDRLGFELVVLEILRNADRKTKGEISMQIESDESNVRISVISVGEYEEVVKEKDRRKLPHEFGLGLPTAKAILERGKSTVKIFPADKEGKNRIAFVIEFHKG